MYDSKTFETDSFKGISLATLFLPNMVSSLVLKL